MIKEISVGAVVFRKEDDSFKFLILYKKPSNHYRESWDFPRGNIEKNETEEETARREIKEETGITDLNFIKGFREKIRFFYKRDGKLVHKEIIYLLAKTEQEKVVLSYEHNDYRWANFDEALNLLTHKSSKEILIKAMKFLKTSLNKFF